MIATCATVSIAALLGACGGADSPGTGGESAADVVKPSLVIVNENSAALTAESVLSINGTYGGGCTSRSATPFSGLWSVVVVGGSPLDNQPLSVVRNNTECVLTLTEVNTDVQYTGDPAIAMTDAYQALASAFSVSAGDIAFYANAKLDSVAFGADFIVTLLISDDPTSSSGGNTAGASTTTATATAENVAAPNYTIDATGIAVETDNDNIVVSAEGDAVLTNGTVTGELYVIDLGTLPESPTFGEIDAVFTSGTQVAISSTIAAASFDLIGLDLTEPQVRTVIVSHEEEGVRSYQRLVITFSTFTP